MPELVVGKVVVSERPEPGAGTGWHLWWPSLLRIVLNMGRPIRYREFYFDLDTVPHELLAEALEWFTDEGVYIYSSRLTNKGVCCFGVKGFYTILARNAFEVPLFERKSAVELMRIWPQNGES